jgi:CRISPR-associated protein Csb2
LAVGYATLHWPAEGPPKEARDLIEKLASVLPCFRLPKAVGAHSRHYMPMARFKNGREETSLVFDTWARVDGTLTVTWDVELAEGERVLLGQLCERMSYLGRAESWVTARVAADDQAPTDGDPCWPEGDEPAPGPGWEQISMLTPMPAAEYTQWRNDTVARALAGLEQPPAGKKPTSKMQKERTLALRPYPTDLVACLQMQTNDLQGLGWSQPPGSRRVFYWRRTDALEVSQPRNRRACKTPPVEALLLSMATRSGNDHALPVVARTLPQAEHLHRQLVAGLHGRHCKVLTGCDERRQPLREPHRHAHILPVDLDGDGHLDHILVWAPMGLDEAAQTAVRRLRQTFTKGGVGPLRLAVAGSARGVSVLLRLPREWGDGLRRHIGASDQWISVTPFVPPRHIKRRGTNTLEGQVLAELASRGLPHPVAIEILDPHRSDLARRQRHIVRSRRFGPPPPIDHGFTLKLRFDRDVQGPICLGYGCHYGLGLFAASAARVCV